jgi:hypothetical protein
MSPTIIMILPKITARIEIGLISAQTTRYMPGALM